jgi:copper chaperone CopZ
METNMITTAYDVNGMTCSHCVASVTQELGRLAGVTDVQVELNAGGVSRVTVASETALAPDTVAAAVDEAGYVLVEESR